MLVIKGDVCHRVTKLVNKRVKIAKFDNCKIFYCFSMICNDVELDVAAPFLKTKFPVNGLFAELVQYFDECMNSVLFQIFKKIT